MKRLRWSQSAFAVLVCLGALMLVAGPAFASLHGFGVRSNSIGWIGNRTISRKTVVLTGKIVCDKGERFRIAITIAQPQTHPTITGTGTTSGSCIDKATAVTWRVSATTRSTTATFKKSPPFASGTARVKTLVNGTVTSSITRTHEVDIAT